MLSTKSTSSFPAIAPQLAAGRSSRTRLVNLGRCRRSIASRTVRAVISSEDKSIGTLPLQPATVGGALTAAPLPGDSIDVRVVLTVRNRIKDKLVSKIQDQLEYFVNGIGQGITVQLVSEEIDPGETIEHQIHQAYLPSQTPDGLKNIRQDVLLSLRGNGKGERKKFEMIYDYALYNDLGNPDKDPDLARPVLGGPKRPYPRRCRTGRPPTKSDPSAESRVEKPHPVYVPRDETFEEIKQNTFSAGALKALFHNLIPALMAALSSSDSQFECFSDIDRLYKDGLLIKSEEQKLTQKLLLPAVLGNLVNMGEKLMKYDIPSIISMACSDQLQLSLACRLLYQLQGKGLRTHAAMEPYIIATHRQLSSMHPIFVLLHPHMRYTLEINALARQSLINGGGIIENCFSPGKYSMELSSAAYKSLWRFDMEALPADLIRRGMAIEDPSMPCGVKLVIQDYPYAADGLLVWSAIEDWVKDYVTHYYSDDSGVTSDVELQAWWDEIKNKGHPDKRNEPWWPNLNTKEDLIHILTIMVWTASGQHAAINFGQYPFGGYMPNRPTLMKKLIPQEDEQDEPEYERFLLNPQYMFLSSLPSQLQATQIMAVQDTLSTHSPDEEYLGQVIESHVHWTNDRHIVSCFEKFSARLEEIDEIINRRNKNLYLKNRSGAGVPPYELLLPLSGPGVTGRGIPNSISI
ncbi:hypothetical protein BHE74_00044309 [Ensete ventricosum]|nr:hypothetical protein BHE74_00044309 [Ensete ventricosum]